MCQGAPNPNIGLYEMTGSCRGLGERKQESRCDLCEEEICTASIKSQHSSANGLYWCSKALDLSEN